MFFSLHVLNTIFCSWGTDPFPWNNSKNDWHIFFIVSQRWNEERIQKGKEEEEGEKWRSDMEEEKGDGKGGDKKKKEEKGKGKNRGCESRQRSVVPLPRTHRDCSTLTRLYVSSLLTWQAVMEGWMEGGWAARVKASLWWGSWLTVQRQTAWTNFQLIIIYIQYYSFSQCVFYPCYLSGHAFPSCIAFREILACFKTSASSLRTDFL